MALIAALVLAVGGAGGASAAGLRTHAGQISGVVKPRTNTGAVHGNSPASELLGASGPGGSPTACPCGSPPLLYGGGQLMHVVNTHVIAWAPAGYSFPGVYVSGFEQYLSDLSHDLGLSGNVSSVLAQYVDASGSALQRLINDPLITDGTAYPTSGCTVFSGASVCLTETQIETELEDEIGTVVANNLSQSYILLLPPGVDSCYYADSQQCEDQYFCGYHSAFYMGGAWVTFTLVPYTASAYGNAAGQCYELGGPSGISPDLMALDSIGTHELFESATDPLGNGYQDSTQNEVADECAWVYGATSRATPGGAYNQLINTDQYLIQEMWSNQDNACLQGKSSTATASITEGSAILNTPTNFAVALQGDSSSATSYDWSYAQLPYGRPVGDAYSGANPQITFTAPGTYTVWVEITDAAGGTITGVTDVTVDGPPTSGFTWSGYSTQAGTTISFTQEASPGAGSITAYSWNFGDGTTSTTPNPSHTYTTGGGYTITLTVRQTDGLTASAQHSITVPAPISGGSASGSGGSGGSGSGSGGSGGNSPGAGGSTGSSGSSGSGPTTGQVASTSWLRALLGVASGQLRIPALLKRNIATTTVSSATVAGRLVIIWYATVKRHKVVVARGAQTVSAGLTAHISIRLTAAGRALLKKARTLKVSATGSYVSGTSTVRSIRTLTLRR